VIPGEVVFRLYDTYGFPVDLTNDIARERDLDPGHGRLRAVHGRAAPPFQGKRQLQRRLQRCAALDGETVFTGYDSDTGSGTVVALLRGSETVEMLGGGESGVVVLDRTPFYAESGGQVGDTRLPERGRSAPGGDATRPRPRAITCTTCAFWRVRCASAIR
jgi:alanyl-tRNA synthetase